MTPPRVLVVADPLLASVACERRPPVAARYEPAQPARTAGRAVVTQRRQLPLVSRGAGGAAHVARALGLFVHRLHGYPARALQRQPGRLGLIARGAEPVLAVGVLE